MPIPSRPPAAAAATPDHLEQPDRRDDGERRGDPTPAPRWWLLVVNVALLQWLGVRLVPTAGAHVRWTLLRYVWPLTGFWSPYRWIAQVAPPLVRALTAAELGRALSDAHAEIDRLRALKEPQLGQAELDALVRMARRQHHDARVAEINAAIAGDRRPRLTGPAPVLADFSASSTYARGTPPPGAPPPDVSISPAELHLAMRRAADVARAGHTSDDAVAIAAEELGLVLP